MNRTMTAILCLALLCVPRVLTAQTCAGGLSFRTAPTQVRVGPVFQTGVTGFQAVVGAGGEQVFGGGLFEVDHVDPLNSNATTIGAFVGSDLPAGPPTAPRAYVCPIVSASFTNGPSIGPIKTETIAGRAGAQVGLLAYTGTAARIIPTFGGAWNAYRLHFSDSTNQASVHQYFGTANFGVGVAFRHVAITPLVTIPFALTGGGSADRTVEVNVSVGF